MGKKLDLSPDDSLLQIEDIEGEGILTGCCCCGQQFHLFFDAIEDLPLIRSQDHYFYIFVCEECNDDTKILHDSGIEKVSYDILWLIQRDLEDELAELEENGAIFKEERDAILIRLYTDINDKFNSAKKEISEER